MTRVFWIHISVAFALCFKDDTRYVQGPESSLGTTTVADRFACRAACQEHARCRFYSFEEATGACETLGHVNGSVDEVGFQSGPKFCPVACSVESVAYTADKNLLAESPAASSDECRVLCQRQDGCTNWTYKYKESNCYMKSSSEGRVDEPSAQSGPSFCPRKCSYNGKRISGSAFSTAVVESLAACDESCDVGCAHFSYDYSNDECYLFASSDGLVDDPTVQSGDNPCDVPCTVRDKTVDKGEYLSLFSGASNVEWCRLACVGDSMCAHFAYDTKSTACDLYSSYESLKDMVGGVVGSAFCPLKEADCLDDEIAFTGEDVKAPISTVASPSECQALCLAEPRCNYFTYSYWSEKCYLKADGSHRVHNIYAQSGPRHCDELMCSA